MNFLCVSLLQTSDEGEASSTSSSLGCNGNGGQGSGAGCEAGGGPGQGYGPGAARAAAATDAAEEADECVDGGSDFDVIPTSQLVAAASGVPQ